MAFKEKIDPASAFIASVHIPAENTAIDGILPAVDIEMVVARGVGRFEETFMVQIGRIVGKAPVGFVYRPEPEYVGIRQGRERYIDPEALKNGTPSNSSVKRGLWVPIQILGVINS